ncbi:ankyrin repeat domain-containing protein [Mucilaginibacter sp. PAMB04274]|uniref:ankyrin repeat domain-containing protein n=1 Tax=Mucilaginibacter sp. PAMB04274 TaxID=3138568 RepID=UPI0031F655BF
MPKKRTTLPKDFEELLSKKSLQELKDIFNQCEVDAHGGYEKQTALAFDNCPHELAEWLIEQGADLQATDTWGNTPLHTRARSTSGNIESLLKLGADINNKSNSTGTPLHAAADAHNVENTKLLLAHGAKADELNADGYTPLEVALSTCNNIDIVETAEISGIYLNAGVQTTSRMKDLVAKIGSTFEFHRANFDQDTVAEVSEALEELYRLFNVVPVSKRILHDGKSPIITTAVTWQKQHQDLWEQLVPSSGHAATIQGEVIRITGRVARELEGNGGVNWDGEYKKMTDALLAYLKQGKQLSSIELAEVEDLVKEVKQKSGNTARLCELSVSR